MNNKLSVLICNKFSAYFNIEFPLYKYIQYIYILNILIFCEYITNINVVIKFFGVSFVRVKKLIYICWSRISYVVQICSLDNARQLAYTILKCRWIGILIE